MRPRKTREQWAELIDQQENSGLTILEFCQQYDVGFASFGKWKRRLNPATAHNAHQNEKAAFIEVSLDRPPTPIAQGAATITLTIGSGITLTIVNPSASS